MTEMRRSMSGAALKLKPHVNSITPTGGPAGILVLIGGTGFEQVTAVVFDEYEAEIVSMTSVEIRCLAPEHPPGTCDVYLITSTGERFRAGRFTYA